LLPCVLRLRHRIAAGVFNQKFSPLEPFFHVPLPLRFWASATLRLVSDVDDVQRGFSPAH
jgi:hypothetical protein